MKKAILFAFLLATIISACKKSSQTTTLVTGPVLYIPHNLDSLLLTPSVGSAGPVISNVVGVFTSCRVSGELTDTTGAIYHYRRNWQNAILIDSVSSALVNGHALTPNIYRVWREVKAYLNSYDDGTVWNDATMNNWTINGITAPSFSIDVAGTMPEFTGTLPNSVSTSSDFFYGFNSSNSEKADSAYFIIYTGGSFAQSPCVSVNGGTAHIRASQFVMYSSSSLAGALTRVDGRIFHGRLMAIVLFNHTFHTIDGKRYVFVNQRIILHMVKLT